MVYDAIIAGGGPAGLSAALILGRSCRKVLVIDEGKPRNRFAEKMNGFPTRDGIPPFEFLEMSRQELGNYGVRIISGRVTRIHKEKDGFKVIAGQQSFACRKVLLATGLQDRLPALPGVENFYGKGVFHCPYCDGWPYRNKAIAVIAEKPAAAIAYCKTMLNWTGRLFLLSDYTSRLSAGKTAELERLGVEITNGCVEKLAGRGHLESISLKGGRKIRVAALFFSTSSHQKSELADMLRLQYNRKGAVKFNKYMESSEKGIYVAGDMVKETQLVVFAAAEGARAGVMINQALIREDRGK